MAMQNARNMGLILSLGESVEFYFIIILFRVLKVYAQIMLDV